MSVRRSLAWAFSGQLLAFVVAFAGSITVARLLSPHEMGIFGIAAATQGILAIFITFGIGSYIIREPDLRPETIDTAFTVNAILAAGLTTLLIAISFAGEKLLGSPAVADVLRFSAISPLIGIFGFRASAMLQRDMQFKTITLIDVSTLILATTVTVICALLGQSYMSMAYGGLMSTVASASAYAIIGRRHNGYRLRLTGWRPLTVFGLRMISVSGVAMMTLRLSDIVLGRVLGLAALGLYGRASNLSNLIFTNVYGTATRIVFIQLAQEFRETGELRKGFLRGLQMITAFMWPLLAGLAILARPAIYILYGEQWLPAALPLSILLAAQFLALGFGMNWELFVLRDETARQTRFEITRSVFSLVVFSIGCLFSIAGAALGRVVDSLVGLAIYYPHVRRLAQTGRGEIPAIYASSAMLTLVAALPSLALMLAYDWSERTPVPMLFGAVALGILLWLAAIFATRHPLRAEIELLVGKLGLGRFRPA